MKRIIIGLVIFCLLVLVGCSQKELCKSPYFEFKSGECCLDYDNNSICDKDETLIKNEAKIVAEKFAIAWESKDYNQMYDLFTPELRKLKQKEHFINLMNYKETDDIVIRLDYIIQEDDKKAFAYYTITGSSMDFKSKAVELDNINGNWYMNTFYPTFINTCGNDVCDNSESYYDDYYSNLTFCPIDCFSSESLLLYTKSGMIIGPNEKGYNIKNSGHISFLGKDYYFIFKEQFDYSYISISINGNPYRLFVNTPKQIEGDIFVEAFYANSIFEEKTNQEFSGFYFVILNKG
jgi:hypothetical protein